MLLKSGVQGMKLNDHLGKISRRGVVLEQPLLSSHLRDSFWIGKSYIQRLHGHKLRMHTILSGHYYPETSIYEYHNGLLLIIL